jgi:hypothetical protein
VRRACLALVALTLVLAACGDDGGDDDAGDGLVQLLQDEAGQPEAVATCVADRLIDEDVDEAELESIIRGEGSVDTATANAYQDATFQCTLQDADPSLTTTG